ncbi:MAG TPA: tRNA1(Val) (adenine(37)-N6)-methyltransferase [Thermodesulfovibrionales bacterium]|nr:tRNA1(Val) (adenine(37)-N6)-methyltransferase [Thermodesulfovibrionales bacterium]
MKEITLDSIGDIRLYQSRTGYRFSVDALLLYSFVNVPKAKKIADLGAGSGVVGLLLAKKYPDAKVSLFELQERLSTLAKKNIALNSLEGRAKVINADIREMKPCSTASGMDCFDIAVSNPPFRKPKTGLISPEEERAIARHEIRLKLPELIRAVHHLLCSKGRFFLIHHPERLTELAGSLKERGMEVKRLRFVHSHMWSVAKMVLVEAVKSGKGGVKVERPLYIYNEHGGHSEEMIRIYGG